ncbi:MAG: VWA domain-containing protein [Actinomycetota bacterium]
MSDTPDWVITQRNVVGQRAVMPDSREIDRSVLPVLATGFVDALRHAGIEVPIGATILYVRALSAVNSLDRAARYWCGRTTLITRSEDFMTYHRVFGKYWTGAEFPDDPDALTVTTSVAVDEEDGAEGDDSDGRDDGGGDPDVVMRYSAVEVLRDKDFAEYTKDELRELTFLMQRMRIGGAMKSSRRLKRSKKTVGQPDLRRTVRRALANDGEPIHRAYRRKSEQRRRVVLLLDISGSMESYSRALLRFVHATVLARGRVEAFALGTRLTRLTREMATLDPDRALANAGEAVDDWSGGTRLGESLRAFNDEWAVRGMARGAVVVILSDGWDRGDPELMSEQMARLSRVAYRIVWSNPLKATAGYQPLARGMAAALPWVDEFVEGHSLGALQRLAVAVNRTTEEIASAS